ncbi:hypothetical protein AB0L74_10380 [Streptomyces sp. NPDC052020]|uniref:hypothetical protein n=1 Tax=Streptomyces sp. NPDC052020 TaxID=3155677 RepID=UPI003423DEC2
MTKLPDDHTLVKLLRKGLSNQEIAKAYGVTVQAVGWRFARMNIQRRPYSRTAAAILNAAYPSSEFNRTEYTQMYLGRSLIYFLRWRLGDDLSGVPLRRAKKVAADARDRDAVLHLDVTNAESSWVWLPREPADGQLILRWPAGREKPKGAHLKALMVPDSNDSSEEAPIVKVESM